MHRGSKKARTRAQAPLFQHCHPEFFQNCHLERSRKTPAFFAGARPSLSSRLFVSHVSHLEGLDSELDSSSMMPHDIHDFVTDSQRRIEAEYTRIQKRATEDPGTAGDQGEENWASLLRAWLPSYFKIVTKGRILTDSGYASPQVDVLVLLPSYPPILIDKKLYLAGGVAAAFECKTTLKAEHVSQAVETSASLRKNLPKRKGSPYRELNSTIIYGLLAHSHCWKGDNSTPLENVEASLWTADKKFVCHPIECIDLLCVSDLATWTVRKMTFLSPKLPSYRETMAKLYGPDGTASTGYLCHAIGQERQSDYFSPLGLLLSHLYSHLAWTFADMRNLEEYFRKVDLGGSGVGKMRQWDITIYSPEIRGRVYNGMLFNGMSFDEWSLVF